VTSSYPPRSGSSLVKREPIRSNANDDLAAQLLWLATQRRSWRSLAVVAASEGTPTMEVATMLARLAWWYRGQPSSVADFRDLSLRLVEYQLNDVASQLAHAPGTIVIALRSISENPTVVPVARTVDAAVLCVRLRVTKVASSQKTVDAIGRDRFLGTIVVDGSDRNGKSR
jgi:hypothetical protein